MASYKNWHAMLTLHRCIYDIQFPSPYCRDTCCNRVT